MIQKPFIERRRYPRLKKILPLKIKSQEYDIVTETKNLSCIGAYCSISKYIAPMTKVRVVLLLPIPSKNESVINKIECQGVVVRVEHQKDVRDKNQYNIAIFFNEINKDAKKKIAEYVNYHLAKSS